LKIRLTWYGNDKGERALLSLPREAVRVVATAVKETGDPEGEAPPRFSVSVLDAILCCTRASPKPPEVKDPEAPNNWLDLPPDGWLPYRVRFQLKKKDERALASTELLVVPRNAHWLGTALACSVAVVGAVGCWLGQVWWSESAKGLWGLLAAAIPLAVSILGIGTSERLRGLARDGRLGLGLLVISFGATLCIVHCGRLVYVENLSPHPVQMQSDPPQKIEPGGNAIIRLGSLCGANLPTEQYCRRWADRSVKRGENVALGGASALDSTSACDPSPGVVPFDTWLRLVPGFDRFAVTCKRPAGLSDSKLFARWQELESCEKELDELDYETGRNERVRVKPSPRVAEDNRIDGFVKLTLQQVANRAWAQPPLTLLMNGTGFVREVRAELIGLKGPVTTPVRPNGGGLNIALLSGELRVGYLTCPAPDRDTLQVFEIRSDEHVHSLRVNFGEAVSHWQAETPGQDYPLFACAPSEVPIKAAVAEVGLGPGFCPDTRWKVDLPPTAFSSVRIKGPDERLLGTAHCSEDANTLRVMRLAGLGTQTIQQIATARQAAFWEPQPRAKDLLADTFFWCDDGKHPPETVALVGSGRSHAVKGSAPELRLGAVQRGKCSIDRASLDPLDRTAGFHCTPIAAALRADCARVGAGNDACDAVPDHWLADRGLSRCSEASELCLKEGSP
jgi:hypothetical protein